MSEQQLARVAAPPFPETSAVERRGAPRFPFPLATLARVTLAEEGRALSAWAVDLSRGGIGLLLARPLESGTAVVVRLKRSPRGASSELRARVAHATPHGDGRWVAGCALDRELADEEIRALLGKGRAGGSAGGLVPQLLSCARDYSWQTFGKDLVAGVVVGLVALPLAMAFAIGSGVPPERGLFTAIVAGFLISALGGSRVQIGGPTGAFVVIVFGIVTKYGYDGLVLATLMAGVMLIVMGLARLGAAVKFIPFPVVTGFTSGIAVVIFSSQINDLLGLGLTKVPPDFFSKWAAYGLHLGSANWYAVGLSAFCLAVLLLWPRVTRKVPAPLVAMLAATVLAWALRLPVETIGSRFGGIPNMLPVPHLPEVSLARLQELIGPAVTIALLAAIESLLSAVAADGLTGGRHRPNMELVAQGLANLASPLFGGIPATGAIARTATNIKTGGRTPVAGMVHALTLLAIMVLFAPLAVYVPLCALASVLVVVCYHMADVYTFLRLLRGPRADVAVLLLTFGLTVVFDLTVAVQIGVLLAAFLFIKRMSDVTNVQAVTRELAEPADGADDGAAAPTVPEGVQVYEVNGPFFFGMADKVKDVLATIAGRPKVFILRMRHVPEMDASGLDALLDLRRKCAREGSTLVLSEIHTQPFLALERSGHRHEFAVEDVTADIDDALARARQLVGARETAAGT